jgi:hypothetical protein
MIITGMEKEKETLRLKIQATNMEIVGEGRDRDEYCCCCRQFNHTGRSMYSIGTTDSCCVGEKEAYKDGKTVIKRFIRFIFI